MKSKHYFKGFVPYQGSALPLSYGSELLKQLGFIHQITFRSKHNSAGFGKRWQHLAQQCVQYPCSLFTACFHAGGFMAVTA